MISLASCLSRVIVFVAVVAISTVLSHTWEEEGVVYGKINDTITLQCNGHNGSSLVEWKFNGSPDIPWGFFTNVRDLQLPNVEPSVMGNYTCHGQEGEQLSSVLLKVGHPPGIPSVTCRASDYHNFSCYWNPSMENVLPTRYITSYRVDKGVPEVCVQNPAVPNMCSVRFSKLWTLYRMNITEINPLGSNFRILDLYVQSIVKPDPPENLSVEPIPQAPRRLRVTWAYPPTWPQEPHFQLKFRIQYRPVLYMVWSVVETANLSDIITDAFVGVEHILQVGARDFLDAGTWSEWSPEARATPWTSEEISGSVPEIVNETTTEEPEPEFREPFADNGDPAEKVAVLISLGVFAFVVLALFLIAGAFIWMRVDRTVKYGGMKADFLTAIHMKALPKTQIL
ncbi:interleukin-11 receptor subunit alpha [Rana temporaria]|uniref:interleukin-11 receptor subunit alpha n=1 Tax=Rana temporaria TaxID=8407 RepID=UPI001AAD4770|nr:interleukin-11 receptor subunit alpha [Rana temporaria]XP_040191561.1 interleukin-11 receptor subunit alpha [Rana temporaria]